MFDAILFAVPVLGLSVTAASAAGSVLLAAHSGPRGRRTRVQRSYVVCGSVLSAIGVATLVCGAWSTHEDAYYDGPGYLLTTSAALLGGHLLLLGLGPFTSWVLGVPARWAGRLPLPARLAAGELADDRARTAPAVATTMNATAVAVAVTIIAVALTAQHRSEYGPQARHGALVVSAFEEQDTVAVRAAVERALPGVPVAQSFRQRQDGVFRPDVDGVDLPDLEMVSPSEIIGDRALLHYLTADPSTPWDDGTAVVLAAGGVDADTVTIEYDLSGNGESSPATTTIPAIAAEPAAPHLQGIFLPAKVVRDLGYHLEPEELIVDPAIHRTSDSERERLEDSLDGVAATYVEQGYQAPAGWRVVVGATLVVAFAGAVAAARRTGAGGRAGRVLLRLRGGRTASTRWFAASRAGLAAACGTLPGAAAGCVIGLSLSWPITASTSNWQVVPRVDFETPWPAIAALVAGMPVLVAVLAALSAGEREAAVARNC